MNKDDIKNTIINISDALEKKFSENKEYDVFREYFKDNITDFEDCNILKVLPISTVIEEKFSEFGTKKYKLADIVLNYQFYEQNLLFIITKKEGSACSVDKSRWLINRWIDYIKEDKTLDMTIDDKCYWKPGFGSSEDWIDYMNALNSFRNGRPEKYFTSVKRLMDGN